MSLPRDEKQEEEDPGSNDHDLHCPEGNAARYVLRHRQLPLIGKTPPQASRHCNR
jgi:hypothetical protein